MITGYRDTSGVNLSIARVSEESTFLVCFPCSGYIATHCIGGKIENVSITSGTKQYRMSEMTFQLSADEIAGNNTTGFSFDHNHIQHFMTGEHLHRSRSYL